MHRDLSNLLENFPSDPLGWNAYQIASFLDIAGLVLVENLRKEVTKGSLDSGCPFKESDLRLIESIFKELSDNFFPMAHSQKPLRDLEIKERQDIADLKNLIRVAQGKMEDVGDIFDELRSCIEKLER